MDALLNLCNQGRYAEAATLAQMMTVRYPLHGFGWKLLGAAIKQMGRSADALAPMQKAAALSPSDAGAHSNLGATLHELGRLDEAEACYRRALQIKPDYAMAHSNLGYTLKDLGRLAAAEASCRRALQINPDLAAAFSNLGYILKDMGRLDEAVSCCRRALQIEPDFAEAHLNLGAAIQDLGGLDEAESSYRRALQINPDNAAAYSNLLFCLSNNGRMEAQALVAEHVRFGVQFETPFRANWSQHINSPNPERCLQVGIVSGDLRNHAVASFIEPVLANLSGYAQLSLHSYSNHLIADAVTQRLRGYFAHWHGIVGLDDATLAEQIRADGIDILIDLSGHTAYNRLLTFARKPAPVQASWMGYPGTTGLRAMDYYLADRFLLPPGQLDDQFTEKIARLPANAPFLPSKDAPPVNPLPALSNGYVTFGSFNRMTKLNPSVIALWAQLLRALPDSRMVLGGMPEGGQCDDLIGWFVQEGIARERLSFYLRSDMGRYLSLHQHVDICLDTFPYNGGTTTLHALWMGVPTLTLVGDTMPGRVGAAVLGHAGLDDFMARDKSEFVAKGLYWASHPPLLAEVRAGLRERFEESAMGKPKVIAAGLEEALRTMWRRWCAGLQAESFEVSLQGRGNAIQEADK
jgi:predicted O-linked N-acetylglucosamine transferase (SPINDLY family)